MSAFTALEQYLGQVKRRWQVTIATRGAGVVAAAALLLTLVCVAFANRFAFADWSVISGRTVLFGTLAALAAVALVLPLLRMRRRGGDRLWVRRIEQRFPAFEERVQTFVDRNQQQKDNPIVNLLAEDTMRLATEAPPRQIAASGPMVTFAGLAVAAIGMLIWLGVAGPGYLGYGTARLWGGWLKREVSNLYQIVVSPGSATIRRKADLLVTAKTVGFYSPNARLFAKFASSERWEEAPMQRRADDTGFEFLFAGVQEPLHYYIAAGGVKTAEYEVKVVDMPNVKRVRLTYRYPSWTGLAETTEDPGGDIRAVAGTDVEVAVETDRPLPDGVLRLNQQSNQSMRAEGNWSRGRLGVDKDGQYFIGALYQNELVRLTDDFFIEAVPDRAPTIRASWPGRDARPHPIEEVTVQMEAEDDFGIRSFDLRYSVNGGPEKAVQWAPGSRKQASGAHTFPLEDLSLVPGDIVSYYGVARDARTEAKTDIFFVEVQPFEREFRQAQEMGGGGGGGGGEDEASQIPRRQKEILSAAWNLARDRNLDKQKGAEHAKTLSGIQNKLRDQSRTLAERMKRRQLSGVNKEFNAFVENMEKAAEAMGPAAAKLTEQKWQEALTPGQKSLQHLLRAESIFREIQVAFGRGGGGGGGSSGRDLAEMFELELDTEKNQYETNSQSAAEQRNRELDEALEKLRQLARRQEQLAQQQRQQQNLSFDQRWQQEMLRREAEDLARRIQEMQQQAAQNGRQQQGQQQQGQQQSGQGQQGSQAANTLQRTLERLQQASRDMQASGRPGQQTSEQQAARERVQQRLREAEEMLSNLMRQQAGQELEDIERRANSLAERQQAAAGKLQEDLRRTVEALNRGAQRDPNTGLPKTPGGLTREETQAMAREKDQMAAELESLEQRMAEAARRMAGDQPKASRKLRETMGNMQQAELRPRMRAGAELLRRGLAPYAAQREEPVTRALNELREGVRETRRLAQGEKQGGDANIERALQRVEQLRQQLEQAMAAQRGQQQGGQQQGQQQGGQQQGGQQQGGQQQGQQQGGQQQGGQQGGQRQPGEGSREGMAQSGPYGGGPRWRYGGDASNRGDWQPNLPDRVPPPPDRVFRDGTAELRAIERALRSDPEFAREVDELRREMQRLDNAASRFPGNPALLSREQQKLLHEVEQLELMLRRKVDEKQGAQVRAQTEQPVPEQYRKAVAEYFRRLSKEK